MQRSAATSSCNEDGRNTAAADAERLGRLPPLAFFSGGELKRSLALTWLQCLPPAGVARMYMHFKNSSAPRVRGSRLMSPVPFSRIVRRSCAILARFALSSSRKSSWSAVTQPPPPWSSNGYKFSAASFGVLMDGGKHSGLLKKPLSIKPCMTSSIVNESEPSSSTSRKNSVGPPNSFLHQSPKAFSTAAPSGSTASKEIMFVPMNSLAPRAWSLCHKPTTSPTKPSSCKALQNSGNVNTPSPPGSTKRRRHASVMFPPPIFRIMSKNRSTSAFIRRLELFSAWPRMRSRITEGSS
mmetsp:Transcript_81017/g.159032  ORF Transcript_81017/g.159032 Transcript_81017/m.159032 type:complete len:296 (+) Transcript_81017:164-1051(+)